MIILYTYTVYSYIIYIIYTHYTHIIKFLIEHSSL